MRFSVLSSGSKANATFIEAASTRILIDCGLSANNASARLCALGIDPATLDGIIVTHEHSDHILGLSTLSRRYKLAVYANRATGRHSKRTFGLERFETGSTFWIGGLEIQAVSIPHDAEDPVGFIIRAEGYKFVHMTDLGKVTTLVSEALSQADALVLESNHDEDMLMACHYPWVLKQRIASSHGHLSNKTAGNLLQSVMHSGLQHCVLAHLSENSNNPEVALKTVLNCLEGGLKPAEILCASVGTATPMFYVGDPGYRMAL